jgi:hypothetical protein
MADVMLEAIVQLKERIDRIQAITRYENEACVQGKRIADVIKSLEINPEYLVRWPSMERRWR